MHSFMGAGCDLPTYPSLVLGNPSVAGRLPLALIIPLAVISTLFLMRLFITVLFTAKLRRNLGRKIRWEDYPQLGPVLGELLKKLMLRRKISVFIFPGYRPLIFNFGWLSPAIFISPLLLEKLNRDELEAVLAHELAHIDHYDQLVVSLVGVLKGLFIMMPYRTLLWRKFMLAREVSCDQTSSRVTGKQLILAEALIKIWKMGKECPVHGWLKKPLLYYALLEKKSSLEIRVRKLLEGKKFPGRDNRRGGLRAGRGLLIALMVVISAMFFRQMGGVGDEGRSTGTSEGYVDGLSFPSCHR